MINNCVTNMLSNNNTTTKANASSNDLLFGPIIMTMKTNQNKLSTNQVSDHSIKNILEFEDHINSNNFNAFDLHQLTKQNSLYFMLQYVY